MKIIEAKNDNGILEVKINNTWHTTNMTVNDNELIEYSNSTKDRVKQAIRLKEAGFTGKEIIDIIGEIE